MRKFKDLLGSHSWDEVIATGVLQTYPSAAKNMEGYEKAFHQLRKLAASATDTIICLRREFEPEEKRWYVCVSGRFPQGTKRGVDVVPGSGKKPKRTQFHALDFQPWAEWLGMEVDAQSLNEYPEAEIIAHCLWEMTFHGFSPDSTGIEHRAND